MDIWVNGTQVQTMVGRIPSIIHRSMNQINRSGRVRRRRHADALRDRQPRRVHQVGEQRQAQDGYRTQIVAAALHTVSSFTKLAKPLDDFGPWQKLKWH